MIFEVTPQLQPDVHPYWIIVSDEGPSSFPHRHETYDSAYAESLRLSKVKPGLKFNIFKFLGYAVASEPKSSFHTYAVPQYQSYWYSYPLPRYHNNDDKTCPF